jgi:ribosome maturation factor RimP
MSPTVPTDLRERIEAKVESLGFECVDIVFALEGSRRILRLTIDAENGVLLDQCGQVSRELAPLLEESAELPAGYHFEVSSPGINRALTKREHFERFQGERVKLRLHEELEGGRALTGVLGPLDGDTITVETRTGTRKIPLAQIARARLHRDLDQYLKSKRRRPGRTRDRCDRTVLDHGKGEDR